MSKYEVVKHENVLTISDGADELYHIIPTGFSEDSKRYIRLDCGPHFNGDVIYMSKDQIMDRYGIDTTKEYWPPIPTNNQKIKQMATHYDDRESELVDRIRELESENQELMEIVNGIIEVIDRPYKEDAINLGRFVGWAMIAKKTKKIKP